MVNESSVFESLRFFFFFFFFFFFCIPLVFKRQTIFVILCLFACTPVLFMNGFYSKDCNQDGGKFFLFRVDPFRSGQTILTALYPLSVDMCKTAGWVTKSAYTDQTLGLLFLQVCLSKYLLSFQHRNKFFFFFFFRLAFYLNENILCLSETICYVSVVCFTLNLIFMTVCSSVCSSVFSYPDENMSDCQWSFTKLGICIDIVEI